MEKIRANTLKISSRNGWYNKSFLKEESIDMSLDVQIIGRNEEEEKGDPGYILYEKLKEKLKCEIFFIQGKFSSLNITRDNLSFNIGINNVTPIIRSEFMGAFELELFKRFVTKFRFCYSSASLRTMSYTHSCDGKMRRGLTEENFSKEIFEHKIFFDLKTGVLKLFAGFPPVIKRKSKEFLKLVKMLVPDGMEETFLMFLAQYAFENRAPKSGRVTLLLYGDRGSGKGFLVESIIGSVNPTMIQSLPSNFKIFNGFVQKKFVFLDENEGEDLSPKALYKLAKDMSGSVRTSVNMKNIENYIIEPNLYLAFISNDNPLEIKEMPTNEYNNQFLTMKFKGALNMRSDFSSFCDKHGEDLSMFIKENIGFFILDILYPIYKEIRKKHSRSRYGFPNPITNELAELYTASKTNYSIDGESMLEILLGTTSDAERSRFVPYETKGMMLTHWDWFLETGFVSNLLIQMFITKRFDLTPRKFKTFLNGQGLFLKHSVKRVGKSQFKGTLINLAKLKKQKLKDEADEKKMTMKNIYTSEDMKDKDFVFEDNDCLFDT